MHTLLTTKIEEVQVKAKRETDDNARKNNIAESKHGVGWSTSWMLWVAGTREHELDGYVQRLGHGHHHRPVARSVM